MKVLVTGTSSGIGLATARKFTAQGVDVVGVDVKTAAISSPLYEHFVADVRKPEQLPDVDVDAIVNNAGVADEKTSIDVNLVGYLNIVEKYGMQRAVSCIVNVASISGHCGLDTPAYAASQGGRLAYTKHLAIVLGKKFGTRVNSISPGATITELEPYEEHVDLMQKVSDESILGKWARSEDIAEWIYFLVCVDKSTTGQDIIVDNGECAKRNFVVF